MKVKAFQHEFVEGVIHDDLHEEVLSLIVPIGNLDREDVLRVYQEDYYARMEEVLLEHYEVTAKIIGDELFHLFARDYIENHPSFDPNINNYGSDFGRWVDLKYKEICPNYDLVKELIDLEWIVSRLFHEKDQEGISLEAVAESSVMIFRKNFKLVHAHYDLYNTWIKEKIDDDFSKDQYLVVHKFSGQVYLRELRPKQFLFFQALLKEGTLEKALELENSISRDEIHDLFFKIMSWHLIEKVED